MPRTLRGKLLASMILITTVAALLLMVIFYLRSSSIIQENYIERLYSGMQQAGEQFDESMSEVYHLNTFASCDEKVKEGIKKYLEKDTEEELWNLSELLHDYVQRCGSINSMYLVIPEKCMIVTSQEYPVYKPNIEIEVLEEIADAGKASICPVILDDPLRSGSEIYSFVSPVTDEAGEAYAYMMSNILERDLYYRYLDKLEDEKEKNIYLLDSENKIISGKSNERGYLKDEQSNQEICVSYSTSFVNCRILAVSKKSAVLADLRRMRFFLLAVFAAALGVAVFLALKISNAMYRPIRALTRTAEQISEGDLDCRTEIVRKDEIGRLSQEFNHMLDQIQELIARVIQEERLKKGAELEALQYQITPHFMYNTLNSIKYAALLKGEEELGSYIEGFIELLQASISRKGAVVTLAEEIHLVGNYMKLQNMRYEEKIEVIYQIPSEVQEYLMPRLMLQPLVENAILHGLDLKNGKNRITIGSEVRDGILYLWVQDYGRGMTEDQIRKLLTKKGKKTNRFSGIGVANVKERLTLYYGEYGNLTYESSKTGTKAQISLPAYKEPDKYVL